MIIVAAILFFAIFEVKYANSSLATGRFELSMSELC